MGDKIKLITSVSKFSPYSYRVEMVLIHKNIVHDRHEVNLSNKPDWFLKDSPNGRVPMLYVGDQVLFESIAICEYLEEVFPQRSISALDPLIKAWHRGWMEFSNGLMSYVFELMLAERQDQFELCQSQLMLKLANLERSIKSKPYFEGEKVMLVDFCFASVFKPLITMDHRFGLNLFEVYPNAYAYAESLLVHESVTKAIPENYEEILLSYLERKKSYLLNK